MTCAHLEHTGLVVMQRKVRTSGLFIEGGRLLSVASILLAACTGAIPCSTADAVFAQAVETSRRKAVISKSRAGVAELIRNFTTPASDDVPIKAGESYVFKLPVGYGEIRNRLAVVKRVEIMVYSLSFGDGTGFRAGVPFLTQR